MRIGFWGIGMLMLLVFLAIANYSTITDKQVDTIFQNIDQNTLSQNYLDDPDLNKFIGHTVKGVAKEAHGGYYLAKFVNRFLPSWITENIDLLIILVVVAMAAPAIFYGFLLIIAIILMAHEAIRRRKQ